MTTDLDRLIEAVEAGGTCPWMDAISPIGIDNAALFGDAQCGSLDAAVTLLEALLPGWGWGRMNDRMFVEHGDSVFSARGPSPARALLLAVLRAKLMEASHE